MRILITGGAGFIGSAFVRHALASTENVVINVDKLTYSGNLNSLGEFARHRRHVFERVDICDAEAVRGVFARHAPDVIVHLAAESHVDRSIDAPKVFVDTNVLGTFTLLEATRDYLSRAPLSTAERFRFVHVSTDEVFGSLGASGKFDESSGYSPSSPYSATKAAADHLVRAWHKTYGIPVIVTNCSNNYGPYQFPEKLIPSVTLRALEGKSLPIYGNGNNVRDWLYVEDHVSALRLVLERGQIGATYLIGGNAELTNLAVAEAICDTLDEALPDPIGSRRRLIAFVDDRPGHDFRYAIDAGRIQRELGWRPTESFASGLRRTVLWYHEHGIAWWHKRETECGAESF